MFVTTKGIVLQRTKYGDSSLVVKIFTEKYGNITFLVKNAFSKKSQINSVYFAPLTLLEVTFALKNPTKLHFLKSVSITYHYAHIPFDIGKNALFLFYNELISKLLYETGEDETLFSFLEKMLQELDETPSLRPDSHLFNLLKLSKILGFAPESNFSAQKCYFSLQNATFEPIIYNNEHFLSKEASAYLFQIQEHIDDAENVHIPPKSVRNELLSGLLCYFQRHNEQINQMNSVEILQEICK